MKIKDLQQRIFLKPYWAQNDKKYKSYFNNTDLFILYGLSLGDSDFWWWNNILNSLLETDSELIIIITIAIMNLIVTQLIDLLMWQPTRNWMMGNQIKLHKKIAIVQYNSKTKLNAFKIGLNP